MPVEAILKGTDLENKSALEPIFKACKTDDDRSAVEAILKIAQAYKGALPVDEIAKAMGATQAVAPKTEEKKVEKALPPEMVALLKERDEQQAALRKELDDHKAALAKELNCRIEKEYIEKAAKFTLAPLNSEVLAKCLREIDEKCSPEISKAMNTAFVAWNEQIQKGGMFNPIGRSGDARDLGMGVATDARATEIKKANPSMTDSQAKLAALRESGGDYIMSNFGKR